jgi:hypothetical protein
MESRVKLFIGERRQPAGVLELHLLRHEERTILRYAAGCVFRTLAIAAGPPCRKSRNNAEMNSELNRARSREGA